MSDRPADPTPDGQAMPDIHPDQLTGGVYPGYDHVMHGPPGSGIGSIWTSVGPDSQGYGCTSIPFDLNDRHRAMIAAGGHVQVNIIQVPMPPINVCIEGPYCKCHNVEMMFDEHDGGFRCAHQREVGDDASPLEAAHRDFKPVGETGAVPDEGGTEGGGPAAPGDPLADGEAG